MDVPKKPRAGTGISAYLAMGVALALLLFAFGAGLLFFSIGFVDKETVAENRAQETILRDQAARLNDTIIQTSAYTKILGEAVSYRLGQDQAMARLGSETLAETLRETLKQIPPLNEQAVVHVILEAKEFPAANGDWLLYPDPKTLAASGTEDPAPLFPADQERQRSEWLKELEGVRNATWPRHPMARPGVPATAFPCVMPVYLNDNLAGAVYVCQPAAKFIAPLENTDDKRHSTTVLMDNLGGLLSPLSTKAEPGIDAMSLGSLHNGAGTALGEDNVWDPKGQGQKVRVFKQLLKNGWTLYRLSPVQESLVARLWVQRWFLGLLAVFLVLSGVIGWMFLEERIRRPLRLALEQAGPSGTAAGLGESGRDRGGRTGRPREILQLNEIIDLHRKGLLSQTNAQFRERELWEAAWLLLGTGSGGLAFVLQKNRHGLLVPTSNTAEQRNGVWREFDLDAALAQNDTWLKEAMVQRRTASKEFVTVIASQEVVCQAVAVAHPASNTKLLLVLHLNTAEGNGDRIPYALGQTINAVPGTDIDFLSVDSRMQTISSLHAFRRYLPPDGPAAATTLLQDEFLDFFDSGSVTRYTQALLAIPYSESSAKPVPHRISLKLKTRHGETVWEEIFGIVRGGRYFDGFAINITDVAGKLEKAMEQNDVLLLEKAKLETALRGFELGMRSGMDAGIMVANTDTGSVWLSKSAGTLLGLEVQEGAPLDLESIRSMIDSCLISGPDFTSLAEQGGGEIACQIGDSVRHLRFRLYQGTSKWVIGGTVVDVTEEARTRLAATNASELSRSILDRIFHLCPEYAWCRDEAGGWLDCTQGLADKLGISRKEVLGRNDKELLGISLLEAAGGTINDGTGGTAGTNWIVWKDGSKSLLEWRQDACLKPDGNGFIFVVAARDITQIHFLKSSEMMSDNVFRTLLETLPLRICWRSLDGACLGGNQAYARDHGFSNPSELLGRRLETVMDAKEAEFVRILEVRALERDAMATGILYAEEGEAAARRRRLLEMNCSPLKTADGNGIGTLLVYSSLPPGERQALLLRNLLRHQGRTLLCDASQRIVAAVPDPRLGSEAGPAEGLALASLPSPWGAELARLAAEALAAEHGRAEAGGIVVERLADLSGAALGLLATLPAEEGAPRP